MQKTHWLQAMVLLMHLGQGCKYQTPKPLCLGTRASAAAPHAPRLGVSLLLSLDQTGPCLSLVSTKRKPVILLQAGSTVQTRAQSLTRLELIWNTNAWSPDSPDTRSSAPAVGSAFAAIVIKLHVYYVWAGNSACAYTSPRLCREIFLGFRLGAGVF